MLTVSCFFINWLHLLISIIIWKLMFDPIVIGPKNKTMQNNVNFYFYIDVVAKKSTIFAKSEEKQQK